MKRFTKVRDGLSKIQKEYWDGTGLYRMVQDGFRKVRGRIDQYDL